MYAKDLSIVIPARNEMFLARTIEDILEHSEADTDVIAFLDGAWADPPIPQHERVNVIHVNEAIGQRAGTNRAVSISRAKYVMKVDAHCTFEQGFDRKMIEGFEKMGDDCVMVPVMRKLWAFDWKCQKCGKRTYQGPKPEKCSEENYKGTGKPCDGTEFEMKMVWIGKDETHSTSYCFDAEPHFQYHDGYKRTQEYKMGAVVGYKLLVDFGPTSSDSLSSGMLLPNFGKEPSLMGRVVELLTDFARSHQFTVLPNSSGLWQNMASDAVGFSPVDNGWGIGVQKISFIRDKSEMERIATLPVLTDVVNYGYILASSTGNGPNKPGIGKTVCEGFLSEFSTPTITPAINSAHPDPTARRVLHSNVLDKFNSILGGEFVYSEKRKCFHNGSVALIPIHDNSFTETMSLQGSCFMSTRELFWKLKLSEEELGNWGNQGIELACKTWLSGNRVLCNHNTWYAHLFRTNKQGFSFPWEVSGRDVKKTKDGVKEQIWSGKAPHQIYPVRWLVEKFWPVPGWTEEDLAKLPDKI